MADNFSKRFLHWLDARGFGALQIRAIILLSTLLVSFVCIMLAADLHFSGLSIDRAVTEQSSAHARMVGALASDSLSNNKLSSIIPMVTTLVQFGDIERIEIVDVQSSETLRVDRGQFLIDKSLNEADLEFISAKGSQRMTATVLSRGAQIEVTLPLYVQEEVRGLVRTLSTNEFPEEKRHEAIQRSIIISLVFLALVLPILFIVIARLLHPIRELTHAAKEMRRGVQVRFSAGLKRDDEIGSLARSFKKMTVHLARSMAEERRLAYVDPVTGLANRERIRRALEVVVALPPHKLYQRAILFIDLDGFKRVNDTLGHDRGDKLLEAVARRFEAVCVGSGLHLLDSLASSKEQETHNKVTRIGRLGGDEFVILGRFDNTDEVEFLAEEINRTFGEPFMVDGHQMEVGASIGIARIPEDGNDASTLMRNADLAMYEAKESGGRRHCLFSDAMGQRMLDRLVIEMELRRAIGNDEIEAFYMPKVHLQDGRLYGFEALARWRHPVKGLIAPDKFIPLAERTGVIADIDRIVLRKAVRQAAIWAKRGLSIPVAVNVSPIHTERTDFVAYIEQILRDAELPGHLLELEVTETAAMQDGARVLSEMARLKALGVRIAIDDFGTGYSNLAQLHKIPANVIKIDGGLVRALGQKDDAELLIKTVLSLAQHLKLDVVAEGIDSEEKHRWLAKLGCHIGQGYLYSPPLPIAKTEAWLLAQTSLPVAQTQDQQNRITA